MLKLKTTLFFRNQQLSKKRKHSSVVTPSQYKHVPKQAGWLVGQIEELSVIPDVQTLLPTFFYHEQSSRFTDPFSTKIIIRAQAPPQFFKILSRTLILVGGKFFV